MQEAYETPVLESLGRLEAMTLGQAFSRCDGNSGTSGNQGTGDSQAAGFDSCTQVRGGGRT